MGTSKEKKEQVDVEGELRVLIATMIRALVDDEFYMLVRIKQDEDGRYNVTTLVQKGDIGKVIGKQGRMARSLRTIIGAFAQREKIKVSLDIQELEIVV